mgnify:CR=1 FL=1
MRRFVKNILVSSLAALVLVACADFNLFDVLKKASIEITGNTAFTVDTKGGNITFDLTSTKDWTVSSGQSWCKVAPSSGEKGTSLITIDVEENTSYDERNAKITFKSDTVTRIITVTQKQKDALLLTNNKVEVSDDECEVSIVVKSNIQYTCMIDSSVSEWISVSDNSSTKGLSNSEIVLKIKKNEGEKRQGKIIVRGGDIMNGIEETVTIYQSAAKPTITLTENEFVVGSEGEEITIEVRSNIDYEMIMPEGVDWLKEEKTKAFSDYTHYITVMPNETYDSREAEIIFYSESEDIYETVSVVQLQKDAIIAAKSEYVLEALETELSFKVSTNVEFEVKTSVDWIELAPETKGLEEVELSFVLEINETTANREGYIILTSENIEQKIKVVQLVKGDSNILTITHNNKLFKAPMFTGTSVAAIIEWGDGKQDNYVMDITHEYSTQKTYTVEIQVWGADEVTLPDIVGVSEIDFTKF